MYRVPQEKIFDLYQWSEARTRQVSYAMPFNLICCGIYYTGTLEIPLMAKAHAARGHPKKSAVGRLVVAIGRLVVAIKQVSPGLFETLRFPADWSPL